MHLNNKNSLKNNGKGKKILFFVLFFSFFFIYYQKIFASDIKSGDVIFSEIQRMGTLRSSADEWIELKNTTDYDIDLNGWTLKTEDLGINISLQGTIKSGKYFLLERTDDNSAYQVKGDLIYSGFLGNGGEVMILTDGNGNIIDKVDKKDNGKWQSGNSSARKSMLKDENGNWIDGEIDGDPHSSFSSDLNGQSGQDGQNGQNEIVNVNEDQNQNQNEDQDNQQSEDQNDEQGENQSENNQIQSVLFDFQRPSYVLEKDDLDLDVYNCDKTKDLCKINFNFERSFGDLKKSDFYCKINFDSLSVGEEKTGEEDKCNPSTVIFPIGDTNVSIKIFRKDGDLLIVEKNILIKNPELIQEAGSNSSNLNNLNILNSTQNIIQNHKNNVEKKKDLSIKEGISKNKFRITKISLKGVDGDFVEISCLDCDKKINIGGYKIYSSKNFFYFPIQKIGKYDLSNGGKVKIFLKKDCTKFPYHSLLSEVEGVSRIFKINTLDKTDSIDYTDNTDKNNFINNKIINKNINNNFCTNKKTGLVSTNGSLFLMNSEGEILDAVCWQNGKEIKGKTLREINILKNNFLWKGECLNTTSLKKGEVFERENFSGYNQSSSWKKLLKTKIKKEGKNKEGKNEELKNNLEDKSIDKIIDEKNNENDGKDEELKKNKGLKNENLKNTSRSDSFLKGEGEISIFKSELEKKIEEIRKQKEIFLKKTKFFKIKLPKKRSRVFRIKGRTLPFVNVKFTSESGENFEIISDKKGYFKIYFDKLKKGKKIFSVKFYKKNFQNGQEGQNDKNIFLEKKLEFFLDKDWISSKEKKKLKDLQKNLKKVEKSKKKKFKDEKIKENILKNKNNKKTSKNTKKIKNNCNKNNKTDNSVTNDSCDKNSFSEERKKKLDKIRKLLNIDNGDDLLNEKGKSKDDILEEKWKKDFEEYDRKSKEKIDSLFKEMVESGSDSFDIGNGDNGGVEENLGLKLVDKAGKFFDFFGRMFDKILKFDF